ncbi:hypothetical protein NDU88_002822 [Pleurodeles waltl]|uniref:Uncharacterized protein n=1 Tax=Pleurodeles waltl TaxID=8319 RepID=A0AAV7KVC2_PLEWA|nr:hypothetical protein NDU88_002822 [Pleurodeles waltl]
MPVPDRSDIELRVGPVFEVAAEVENRMHAGPAVSGVQKMIVALPEVRKDRVCHCVHGKGEPCSKDAPCLKVRLWCVPEVPV